MLELILTKLGGAVIQNMFGGIIQIAQAYINKQVSEIDAKKMMVDTLIGAAKDVEVTHAQELTKTYDIFWKAAGNDGSGIMKIMWAAAVGSQIFVLFWSQFFVPMMFAYGLLPNWKAGTTAEWSYLLLAGLLGMGPMVLRGGPGAGTGGMLESIKNLIKR